MVKLMLDLDLKVNPLLVLKTPETSIHQNEAENRTKKV